VEALKIENATSPLARPTPNAQGETDTMNEFFNRESESETRRRLRNATPEAEVILWSRLKGRQLLGCKFRRQYSVGSFVIDFFSVEIKLGIELDGESHFRSGAPEYDRSRQHFIESFGIRIVRILNTEVYENLDGVLEVLGREVLAGRERGKTL
jgi:very-short-patch-repair endonuclease